MKQMMRTVNNINILTAANPTEIISISIFQPETVTTH